MSPANGIKVFRALFVDQVAFIHIMDWLSSLLLFVISDGEEPTDTRTS